MFYHGTSMDNYFKILDEKVLKSNGSCASDDFRRAKTYAQPLGVVLSFYMDVDYPLTVWIQYYINRYVIKPLFGNREAFMEWYHLRLGNLTWGSFDNSIEIPLSQDIPIDRIVNTYLINDLPKKRMKVIDYLKGTKWVDTI
jgi:hypothetical protein